LHSNPTHWSIDSDKAAQLLKSHYGIGGKLTLLPGEIDLNFKVTTADKKQYVFKIAPEGVDSDYLDFQQKILLHLKGQEAPQVISDINQNPTAVFYDDQGEKRFMRLLSWISGRVWSQVNPYSETLRYRLGVSCGSLTQRLQSFDHPYAHRYFEWDLAQGIWVEAHLSLFNEKQKATLQFFIDSFKDIQEPYQALRKSVVHNDANDNNIIVSEDTIDPSIRSLIDYGDAIHTQTLNDLAICCAYAVMDVPDPLEAALPVVKGYHDSFPLEANELAFLYILIGMRLVVSVTKSAINKIENPSNEYLGISEKPAWELLQKWVTIDEDFAHFRFREACGLEPHPHYSDFVAWAKQEEVSLRGLFPTLERTSVFPLDLSVSSSWVGGEDTFNDLDYFQFKLNQIQKTNSDKLIAGGYLEPRSLYTSSAYDKYGNEGLEKRCIHLGVDFWVPPTTPVHALYEGEVVMAVNDEGEKAYGGMIVLRHTFKKVAFYSLYGHLSKKSITNVQIGEKVGKGACIGWIGTVTENGNWAPHLHFQLTLSLLGYQNDFPGVAYHKQIQTWQSLCPDPNLLFKSADLSIPSKVNSDTLIKDRKAHLGRGMSLQYQTPIHVVRGAGAFLVDQNGRHYLDMVNNVAHVGHEHPKVVKAGQLQMGQLNTNTRYLHENITRLAKRLTATLPKELSVVHFVNSGSEANELALRMIKTVTGSNQILACESGYHGNTNACIDISSYKFDGKGGSGKPEQVHIFPIPDSFRGKYRGVDTAGDYVVEVEEQIALLEQQQKKVGGLIIEPIISCGGQIELPKGFLQGAFKAIRKAGGLCVVDEVQTGCGRVGSHFWGFELHGVVPDIVTIGKPLGNGHPVAAVVCTPEIASQFNNGMEFFNTFGGNPVSCAIAHEVLEVIEEDKLQENARIVGNFLKLGLSELAKKHPILGEVRGQGLFLGVEFVNQTLQPLAAQADYMINRMKTFGVLLSTDGPDHNVIKIKPPLVFSMHHARYFLNHFSLVLQEDFMK
jgi:4-aminobutyrate aminotransferase-like enzyme/Ser/Thr protein kinase RdoA (MazF antagonist)/murein DD-endopeptidase MepM/ murein hydrolase activator NlpD